MLQIWIGSLALSFIHASVPNHWIPLVALSKTEHWSRRETLRATLITGFAHTLSTVLIGILVGVAGYKLTARYAMVAQYLAPAILAGLGLVYLILDVRENMHHDHHGHGHNHKHAPIVAGGKGRNHAGILTTLSLTMFLTPCAEIEAYYFQAGTLGWPAITLVSAVYTLTTVVTMLILVSLGLRGVKRFTFHFLEHHEKSVTGMVLLALGLLLYFVKF